MAPETFFGVRRPPPPPEVGAWLATAPVLPKLCRLKRAHGVDDSKFIQCPFHTSDGQQVHYLWGQEAEKGKTSNKKKGERLYKLQKKRMSVCTTILHLFQKNPKLPKLPKLRATRHTARTTR